MRETITLERKPAQKRFYAQADAAADDKSAAFHFVSDSPERPPRLRGVPGDAGTATDAARMDASLLFQRVPTGCQASSERIAPSGAERMAVAEIGDGAHDVDRRVRRRAFPN